MGFPDSSVGKESACNVGDPRIDCWDGKNHWRRDKLITPVFLGFPCSSAGRESARSVGDLGLIRVSGRSPGEGYGNPFQYSCLENPIDRGAWQAIVHGITKSRTQLSMHPRGKKEAQRKQFRITWSATLPSERLLPVLKPR